MRVLWILVLLASIPLVSRAAPLELCKPMLTYKNQSKPGPYGLNSIWVDSFLVLPPGKEPLRVNPLWPAMNGQKTAANCYSFAENDPRVFVYVSPSKVKPSIPISQTLAGFSTKFPFTIKVVGAQFNGIKTLSLFSEKIASAIDKVAPYFPLGVDPANKNDFYFLVTYQAVSNEQKLKGIFLAPEAGENVIPIWLPNDHPDFETHLLQQVTQLFTVSRPHPKQGPAGRFAAAKDTSATQPESALSLKTYNGIVASFIALQETTAPLAQNLFRVSNAVADLIGATDESGVFKPMSLALKNYRLVSSTLALAANTSALENAPDNPHRAFLEMSYYPLLTLSLSSAFHQDGKSIKQAIIDVNAGKAPNLDTVLGKAAFDKAVFTVPQLLNGERSTLHSAFLQEGVRLKEDHSFKRPEIIRVASEGANLDTRLYLQQKGKQADRVFVLSHSPAGGTFARPLTYDLMAYPLIQELLKQGDVLVAHRRGFGETTNANDESFGACKEPDYLNAAINTGIHLEDAARMVERRGYTQVIGVGNGSAALGFLAAARGEKTTFTELWLDSPQNGVDLDGTKVCQPNILSSAIEQMLAKVKVPVKVALRRPEKGSSFPKELETIWNDLFPKAGSYTRADKPTWLDEPTWIFELAPDIWLSRLAN